LGGYLPSAVDTLPTTLLRLPASVRYRCRGDVSPSFQHANPARRDFASSWRQL